MPGVGPLRGGVRFVNDGGTGRRQGLIDKNNFGPRVGVAYSLANNTVIRAGYGIFYSSDVNHVNAPTTDGAFGAITQYVGSTGGDTLPIPGVSLSNPFPNGYVQPTGKSLGKLTDLGSTVTFVNPNRVLPYVQQWQFSLQKQFRSQVLGEVAYVGMHSVKLFENLSLNETPDNELSNTDNVPNPFLGILPAVSTLGQGSTVKATQLIKTYPQLSTVTMQRNNDGRVLYHSLQTRMQKRFSNGLQLVANYTHSKSMQYLQTSSVNVRHNNRTVSAIDIPNMVNRFPHVSNAVRPRADMGKGLVAMAGFRRGRMDRGLHHALPERRCIDGHGHEWSADSDRQSEHDRRGQGPARRPDTIPRRNCR